MIAFAELGARTASSRALTSTALELGLECAVDVRDEAALGAALERVDPEIFLLAAGEGGDEAPLERALDLLQDVPAGKLAIAEMPAAAATTWPPSSGRVWTP